MQSGRSSARRTLAFHGSALALVAATMQGAGARGREKVQGRRARRRPGPGCPGCRAPARRHAAPPRRARQCGRRRPPPGAGNTGRHLPGRVHRRRQRFHAGLRRGHFGGAVPVTRRLRRQDERRLSAADSRCARRRPQQDVTGRLAAAQAPRPQPQLPPPSPTGVTLASAPRKIQAWLPSWSGGGTISCPQTVPHQLAWLV